MDEIINLLQSLMQQAAELADELTDEEMAQVLKIFQDAIEMVQGEGAITTPKPIGEIPASEYPSSNVNGFMYNPDSGELLVQFHGPYPLAEGSVYSYGGVPKFIYDILEKGAIGPKTSGKNRYHEWIRGVTPSLGGTLNALVKAGGFPYTRLS